MSTPFSRSSFVSLYRRPGLVAIRLRYAFPAVCVPACAAWLRSPRWIPSPGCVALCQGWCRRTRHPGRWPCRSVRKRCISHMQIPVSGGLLASRIGRNRPTGWTGRYIMCRRNQNRSPTIQCLSLLLTFWGLHCNTLSIHHVTWAKLRVIASEW